MRSSRTTALAMAGVLSLGLLAACSTRRRHPSGGESRRQGHHHGGRPAARRRDGGRRRARRARRGVRGGEPGHQRRAAGVRLARVDLLRAARRWHAAERLRDPADRRQDAHRERPAGRHLDAVQELPVVRGRLQREPARGRHRRGRQGLRRSPPSPSTASRCTTTASCSSRPASTPTSRRRRGTRSASTPRPSTTPPVSRATRRWRSTTRAAGSWPPRRTRAAVSSRSQDGDDVHRDARRPGGQGAPASGCTTCASRTTRSCARTDLGWGEINAGVRRRPAGHVHVRLGRLQRARREQRASPRTGATASRRSRRRTVAAPSPAARSPR